MKRQGKHPFLPDESTRKPERIRQYGYLRPDGVQVWFGRDHHGNGIASRAEAIKRIRAFQDEYTKKVGVVTPVELIFEDHITTRWSRWTGPTATGEFIGGDPS